MNSFLPDEQTPGAFAEARARLGKELIVNRSLPTRALREHPDLDQLKTQAKELLQAFIAGDEKIVAEVNAHYHDADRQTFALHDAQLVLARAYGFDSWPRLKAELRAIQGRTECLRVSRSPKNFCGQERVAEILKSFEWPWIWSVGLARIHDGSESSSNL